MKSGSKSFTERLLHAFFYELIAIVLSAPAAAWAMGQPVFDMGVLTAAIAAAAMLWNMVYNSLFERAERRWGWRRSTVVRILHALGFEGGLVLIVVPLAAWWLGIGWWDALLLDLGLLLFYLPYTYVYNLVYDALRARGWWGRGPDAEAAGRP
ncbi:multidrug/biocide efflux PACE transporter [Bordetella sp. 2513F-2]